MQNSNPTILNAADLPTRKPAPRSSRRKSGLYEGTIFADSLSSTVLQSDPFADSPSESEISEDDGDNLLEEPIDEQEVYDLISTISDPEHPISLGSLAVVSLPDIHITPSLPDNPSSPLRTVTVLITPTITHCSLATVIGLGVRVRLEQSLPPRFRVDVRIKEGTHSTANEVNKQLADKERVAAALENGTLMNVIGKMLETCQ
ncbi:hypothetical protein VTO42DRAFT_6588 [Malbranchea cinnamomea]